MIQIRYLPFFIAFLFTNVSSIPTALAQNPSHFLTEPKLIKQTDHEIQRREQAKDLQRTFNNTPLTWQAQGQLDNNSPRLQEDNSRYQLYTLHTVAGQTVIIHLRSHDFNPYLILINENDRVLAQNDNEGSASLNSRIVHHISQTGTYYIASAMKENAPNKVKA
jgi:hypothetical protein